MISAAGALADTYAQIASAIQEFEPITLPELLALDNVALLDRMDVKFLLRPEQLLAALPRIASAYRVLSVNNIRLQHYHTRYFDTDDFVLYLQHHNDARSRYKVRFRTYLDSQLSFLEVKVKNNKDRTIKTRMQVPEVAACFDGTLIDFLRTICPWEPRQLTPKIDNSFVRVTLVGQQTTERLTLDFGVQFDDTDANSYHPYLVIAEVKQHHFAPQSEFLQQMRRVGSYELGLTKYCIGAVMRYGHLKCNNFKPVFLLMNRLAQH